MGGVTMQSSGEERMLTSSKAVGLGVRCQPGISRALPSSVEPCHNSGSSLGWVPVIVREAR